MRALNYIKSDLYRYTGKQNVGAFVKLYFVDAGFAT